MSRVKLKGFFILDFGFVPVSKSSKQPSVLAMGLNVPWVLFKSIPVVNSCAVYDPVICKQTGIKQVRFWILRFHFECYDVIFFGFKRLSFFFSKASITEIRFNVIRVKFKSLSVVIILSLIHISEPTR